VKIDDEVETAQEEPRCRFVFSSYRKDLIEIGITGETVGEPLFHENGNPKRREFLLERPDGSGEQETIAHRAKPNQKDAGVGWKTVEKIFSLQLSLR
jgi:hypothetical protein